MTVNSLSLSPLDEAVRLNNEGAQLLTEGNHSVAIERFKVALAAFHLASVSDDEEIKTSNNDVLDSSERLRISQVSVPGLEDVWFYVFNKAFVLETTCALPHRHLHLASTASLLNLCLAFHCGVTKGGATIAKVHKICRLYQMAGRMLETTSDIVKEQNSISFMKILVLNNLAHLAFQFDVQDLVNATHLLEDLQFDLAQLTEAKKCFASFVTMDPVVVHEITTNTVCVPMLRGSYKASTPAA